MPFPREREREREAAGKLEKRTQPPYIILAKEGASLTVDARRILSTPVVNINKQTAASAIRFVPAGRLDRPVERNKARRDRVLALLAFVGRHLDSAQPRPGFSASN